MIRHTLTIIGLLLLAATPGRSELYFDGFLQSLHGARLDNTNPTATDWTASETRMQLRAEHFGDAGEFFGRLDFTYDGADTSRYEWELREGYLKFSLGQNLDFKVGRQILTWGTGDLLFINDVFAKDYLSFFVGRDDQYLKAPQDAMRAELYTGLGALSAVWTPRFEANRLPTGRKLSYFNGQEIVGDGFYFDPETPDPKLKNSEIALRLNGSIASFSTALYYYHGYYKNPLGAEVVMVDGSSNMMPVYPELNVYGASVRGQVAGGIVWLEGGYYDSRQDRDGDNPLMPNSQMAGLIGFERQIATNLTVNAQWQAEYMRHHDTYAAQNQAAGRYVRDEVRHLATSRITKLLMDELLTLSGFVFVSPTDEDGYVRLSADYKYSDEIGFMIGGNIFGGRNRATEFGQLKKNDNMYLKVTYGF